jgi:hypothetical protein
MKKITMIVFAAIFVLFLGTETLAAQSQGWRITNTEGARRGAANNTVNVARGESYLYIYFDEGVPGGDFDTIRLEFTADNPVDLFWMAIYCPGQVWGRWRGGQNKPSGLFDYPAVQAGPIQIDWTPFTFTWTDLSRNPLTKSDITGICINIRATTRTAFQLTNVTFVGLR